MTSITNDTFAQLRLGASPTGPNVIDQVVAWYGRRRSIAEVSRQLSSYTDRQLEDMGLTRMDIPAVARGKLSR